MNQEDVLKIKQAIASGLYSSVSFEEVITMIQKISEHEAEKMVDAMTEEEKLQVLKDIG